MTNYRVREAMAVSRYWPPRQRALLVGLATFMRESTNEVTVSNADLAEAAALHPQTVKTVKREMRNEGKLDYDPGLGRGKRTSYTVRCLKRGVTGTPLKERGATVTPLFGRTEDTEKGSPETPKRGVPKPADQDFDTHRLIAKAISSPARTRARDAAADLVRKEYPDADDREIKIIAEEMTGTRGWRSAAAGIRHAIEQGTLRLPCDRDGPQRHASACRSGDSKQCGWSFCECRCHTIPGAQTQRSVQ